MVTLLIENSKSAHLGLETEHGLSMLIEDEGTKILFDCGSSGKACLNARRLCRELGDVDVAVCSHAHYDHTGGFPDFAAQWRQTNRVLISGPTFFEGKYEQQGDRVSYIGPPFSAAWLIESGVRFEACEGVRELTPSCRVVSGFPRAAGKVPGQKRFAQGAPQALYEDRFEDECCLVIQRGESLAVLVGCAHAGIVNMVSHVERLFRQPVESLWGGIHMLRAGPEELQAVLDGLSALGVRRMGLSHCSGDQIGNILADRPEFQYVKIGTGDTLLL